MEDENKEHYFRYYQPRTAQNPARSKQQMKQYHHSKILPHIIEEYNYRITNYLLIKKIISPKRDKTIMQSLQSLTRKYHSAHATQGHQRDKSGSRDNPRSKDKHSTLYNFRAKLRDNGYQKRENGTQGIIKTVSREGRIAHRSLSKKKSEQILKTQGSSIISNDIINDINATQKAQGTTHEINMNQNAQKVLLGPPFSQKLKENIPLHGYCFKNHPTGYGSGPTVMLLTHLQIDTNPVIKPQTLIQLQLVERPAFTRSYLNITYSNTEKTIKTEPFKYCQLPKPSDPLSCIKFCIRALKIGDFVPLRIWKYLGVQSILVGTIDLPLNAHSEQGSDTKQKVEVIPKKTNDQLIRKVFHGQVQRNLMTNKMFETESIARVKYRVYPKKFRKREECGLEP